MSDLSPRTCEQIVSGAYGCRLSTVLVLLADRWRGQVNRHKKVRQSELLYEICV